MTGLVSRYVPGDRLALVAADAWLLADVALDVRIEDCWLALRPAEPDSRVSAAAVLEELFEASARGSAGFAFVYQAEGVTRVVVRGTAVVEVTAADGSTSVVRQEDGSRQFVGGLIRVRLASSTDDVHEVSALPIESGVVMASVVEYVDDTAMTDPPVPERVVEPDSDEGYLDGFMEPGDGVPRLVETADLDWMSSSPSEPPDQATEPAAEPEPIPEPEPASIAPVSADRTLTSTLPGPALTSPAPAPQSPELPTPSPPQVSVQPPTMFGTADQTLVAAVRCPAGHLTSTESIYCRVCRAAVAPQEPMTVARPCLGRLRLSNGEVYPLDRDAVFGRRPEIPVGRPGPRPNAIVLTDDRDVSRNHVEIRLDGWRVLALDLGSMNGTQLAGPNIAPRMLPQGTAQEIVPGSVLTLAPDVWIYFEENR